MLRNLNRIRKVKDNIVVIVITLMTLGLITLPKEEIFWQSGIEGKYIITDSVILMENE